MAKIAVVYWSATGNTEAMANAVADGAKEKGAEVDVITAAEFAQTQFQIMMHSHSAAPEG